MKVLIWFLCFFVNALITTLLSGFGVSLGAIPTVLLFAGTCWCAKTLCAKWNDHKKAKNEQQANVGDYNKTSENVKYKSIEEAQQKPPILFCRKCGEKLLENSCFCRKCGEKVIK